MEARSESDILKKTLTLRFGEKEYEVPVLRMLPAAAWRKEYFSKIQQIRNGMNVEDQTENPKITKGELAKAVGNAVAGAMLTHVDQIPEIVFSYAQSLPREEVMESAYDNDFVLAFKQIWGVAFAPFLESLGLALEMSKLSDSRSGLSGSLN